ncbi:MAG: YbaN family protein [Burkholderiaceae bacterium]|nr:YbaN family protein [Burkholderiaceae bacterium]
MDHLKEPAEDEVRKHRSMTVRVALVVLGTLFLVVGVIGIFTPLLPTTPFVLLAAACYARASSRFYGWLLRNRSFGPMIREWRRHRSIAYRTKLTAIAMMAVTMAASILLFVRPWWVQLVVAGFGLVLGAWMYRIPSRDAPLRTSAGER